MRQLNKQAGSTLGVLLLASVIIVVLLGLAILRIRSDATTDRDGSTAVRVYCAAGMVKPIEQLIEAFERTHQTRVEIVRSGGSGELFGQVKTEFAIGMERGADIFVSADDELLSIAANEKIVSHRFPLAEQRPVIAVRTDRGLQINSLAELVTDPSLKFGIALESAAIGKLTRQIAQRDGLLDRLEANKSLEAENVMTLAQALVVGSLDAAIVWDTTVRQLNEQPAAKRDARSTSLLSIVCDADPSRQIHGTVAIGLIATAKHPAECLEFIEYAVSEKTGRPILERFGFTFYGVELK